MKWYWWVLIAVVLIVIIVLVVKNRNSKNVAVNTTVPKEEFDPYVLTPLTAKQTTVHTH